MFVSRPALKDLFVDEGIEVVLDFCTIAAVSFRRTFRDFSRCECVRNDSRGGIFFFALFSRLLRPGILLGATARKANSDGSGLDKTGVQLDEERWLHQN